jgi:hypothetical protein
MNIYQPIIAVGKPVGDPNEYYHYRENAQADYPERLVVAYDASRIENPVFVDKIKTKIRIVHDDNLINPFEDWDGEYPLMYNGGRSWSDDFSKGDIDKFLNNYLTYNQVGEYMSTILDLINYDEEAFIEDFPSEDYDQIDELQYLLCEFIEENIENKVAFCEEFGVKYYSGTSTGYSQGDWADVFICWTPEFGKVTGVSYEDTTEERLKSSFDLFTCWAWGDVYGFIIEREDTEDIIDSCWGFFGRDYEENGMLDYIMDHIEDKTREEVLEILDDIEVEYRY